MGLIAKAKFLARQFPFIFPKKIIGSCEQWIDGQQARKGLYFTQRGPWYKTIFAEGFLHHNSPKTLGVENLNAFYNNRDYKTGASSLFSLQNSYLLGHKGIVMTANHEIFQQFSHHFGISSIKKFFWRHPFYTFSTGFKKVEGVGAVLISPESHNYYHWLSDVLPRIKLYESVLDKIGHFCIASNVPAKFLEVLPLFGMSESKILLVSAKEKLHFDYIYVASLPGSEGRTPEWAVEYVRETFLKNKPLQTALKKLYFKRGDNEHRKIINESAIIKILEDEGFEIIEPGLLSIREQIDLMQQATTIVSAHGAALSNLLFSRENTTVVEIFSPDYFRTDCYYTLAAMLKLNYWYITGQKPVGANWGDIVVPEELLIKTIEQVND